MLSQSRAIYNESNSGYIVLNLKSRGGIVPDEEAPELTQKIAALYEPFRQKFLDKIELTSRNPAIPNLGEIYLMPRFKVTLQEEVEGKVFEEFFGGQHHYWADSEPMKAVLYFIGAGVPAGKKLGPRSHLEIAPTIAALAGISPPDKARKAPIKF